MVGDVNGSIKAFIFDMDGVVTDTADAHFDSWKQVFEQVLRHRASDGCNFDPFTRADYLEHVDGVPRYDGVRRFLAARGIDLPEGDESDEGEETIFGVGNLKNRRFRAWLAQNHVPTFEDARTLIETLRRNGVKVGVFSASRNARRVLESSGTKALFEAAVDGADARELGLAGKPDPAALIEAARRLGCDPAATAVVEDAISGVTAGSRGRFGLVVGVNRQRTNPHAQRLALRANGADLVVADLRRLLTDDGEGLRTVERLPSAFDCTGAIMRRIGKRRLAIFLDYDGTLTPIVPDYRKANIERGMVDAIARLAGRVPVAIISGRDLDDVRARVGLDHVFYAGSHGFDIAGPGGLRDRPDEAEAFLPPLREAEGALREALQGVEGAKIEHKTFSIAVHVRNVAQNEVETVERTVDEVIGQHPQLRKGRGKKVFEIQPRADWDKGCAVSWLLDNTRPGEGDALPLYVGDDITDEDAFAALAGRGVSIIVRGGDRITTADYALDDAAAVGRFLDWLGERAAGSAQ